MENSQNGSNEIVMSEDEAKELERREKFETLGRELADLEVALSKHGLGIRVLIASIAKHQHGVVIPAYIKSKKEV